MRRDNELLKKRREFVRDYINDRETTMKVAIEELSEMLFLSKRTIFYDLKYIKKNNL